jgi:uncharacterized coiled-coil protein SlyX
MDEIEKSAKRLTNLETSMMHLQNDFDSLNNVVMENARRLERMANTIQALSDRVQAATEPLSQRDSEDEVPPHY